ncbi:prepilin peptidase [Symbioplanes lichenis]|uniref:prepilin peptidase n=1 Tax=Symbioplanes lichenis TaxID=1629072 RepID=UPI002739DFAC|nr:A24 family peptidase [Actinoplanes lichenis]
MPQPLLLGIVGMLGLAVGSFLNVVIHRVPRGESLVRPGSHCPACGHEIRPRHNIPVAGWLLLRGRCADCEAPISARYPLVEAGTAALFLAVTAKFGWSWELPAFLYLAAIAVALTMIDLDVFRLPDQIVLPSYSVALFLLLPPMIFDGQWTAGTRALIAAALVWGFFLFLRLFKMGWGDIKLAPLLALYLGWLGWSWVLVGLFAGFVIGGFAGSALMAAGRATRKSKIPYGPFLLAGAFLAIFAGAPIADWYSSLLTPTV